MNKDKFDYHVKNYNESLDNVERYRESIHPGIFHLLRLLLQIFSFMIDAERDRVK
jgi:hypothetical protein